MVRPVFRAGRQLAKIRWIVIPATAIAVVAAAFGAVHTLLYYGVHPQEGGTLAPFGKRAALSAFFVAIAVLGAWGLPAFLRRYIARIDATGEGDREVFHLVPVLGRPIVATRDDVERTAFHLGTAARVHAPSYSVRLRGHPHGIILDYQGEVVDERAFERLLGGA